MSDKLVQFLKSNMTSIITLVALIATIKTRVEYNEKEIIKINKQLLMQASQDISFYKDIQKSISDIIYKIGKLEGGRRK